MTLQELKQHAQLTIDNIKNYGIFPKENELFDYKAELNFFGQTDSIEIFMRNLAKDILAFTNSSGGIVIFGISEDKTLGTYTDTGLNTKNLEIFEKIDVHAITQKFEKIAKVGVSLDLLFFQSGTRKFHYLVIEKQNQVLIPVGDFPDYKIKKGEIIYRTSSKNEVANTTTTDFNRFLQLKANEKNKEFMEIWSKLLPEIFEINPREVLIINPKNNILYGFNGKENILSSSRIEIDKSDTGVFNIILNAISAGEIGKISNDEGKPLYKIVGEVSTGVSKEHISLSTVQAEVYKKSKYKLSSIQIKQVIYYLGWVTDADFKTMNPVISPVNKKFEHYIWLETFDKIKDDHKVVCSLHSIDKIVEVISETSLHKNIFGRILSKK